MKKLGIVFLVVLAVIAGGLFYLHANMNELVKVAIEKYGSQAAQTEVRLDNVKLSIASGEGALNGLTVANPKGFSDHTALGLGTISVKLDTNSISSKGPLVIRQVIIEKPAVNFEADTSGNSNLQQLEKNLSGGAQSSSGSSDQGQSRKIIISDLIVRDGQIGITHPLLKQPLTAPLPVIHLTNIGKSSGGATPAQVADKVLASITSSATHVASSDLAKNLSGAVKDVGGSVGKQLNGLLGR